MKKCNHIKKIIKEYWGLLLILGFSPVIINYIVLMPSFLPVVGDSEKWLSFFGSFAGSVIMTGVTLYVLQKQLKQNHDENEENRIANEKANKENRASQNKLTLFQVETHNLHLFKESCLTLLEAYNYNRFVQIYNSFILDSKSPLDLIKIGFSDVIKAKRSFLMNFMPSASKMGDLIDMEKNIFDYYNAKLLDIEAITSYQYHPKNYIKTHIITDEQASESLALIIKKNIAQLDDLDSKTWLDKILKEYFNEISSNFIDPLWDLISDVYLSEKARIAKILVE